MLSRRSLPAGLILLTIATTGCKNHDAPSAEKPSPLVAPTAPVANKLPVKSPALSEPAPGQISVDDATILARKTAEYAQSMAGVLNNRPAPTPATRPSIVSWADPRITTPKEIDPAPVQKASVPNQPADLGNGMKIAEDTSVPLTLPEDADHIPRPAAAHESPAPGTDFPKVAAVPTDEYESKLQKLVQDDPRDLSNQLNYQLLRFVRGEKAPDAEAMSQLPSEDQAVIVALVDGLSNFRSTTHVDPNLMLSRKIQPLMDMADQIRTSADLTIPTVSLCTQVASYGVYRPMKSNKFPVGQTAEAIVYNEVSNFQSTQGKDGVWRTRLRQEMVLYTDSGLAVWPDKSNVERYVDQSHNRRHDFFISRRIALPSTLAVGKYLLKVRLTDEESNRAVEAGTPLEIIAPLGNQADANGVDTLLDSNRPQPSDFRVKPGE